MKKKYEGVYILSDSIKAEALDAAKDNVKADIQKAGGTILTDKPLERRAFARPMRKQHGGHYLWVLFEIDTDKVAAMKHRHALDTNLFRNMITVAGEEPKPAAEAAPATAAPQPAPAPAPAV